MWRKFAMTRDARLSALHRGGFGLRGRASLPGICAGSVTASSSHPGRNAWRAGSRASRGERLRAAAAGRHSPLRLQARTIFDLIGVFALFGDRPPERPCRDFDDLASPSPARCMLRLRLTCLGTFLLPEMIRARA